jgi:hypothetical protein
LKWFSITSSGLSPGFGRNRAILVKIEVASHADAFVLFESLKSYRSRSAARLRRVAPGVVHARAHRNLRHAGMSLSPTRLLPSARPRCLSALFLVQQVEQALV